ncbi:MAG: fluoride efflux transporter CrcB [Ignavibacteriales bacterium]
MLAAIAVGGAVGAVFRYLISWHLGNVFGVIFPWGTLAINLSGSFLMGILHSITLAGTLAPQVRSFAAIGMVGAFTTFSTFALESLIMLREGEAFRALGYVLLSTILGVFCALVGLTVGNIVARGV